MLFQNLNADIYYKIHIKIKIIAKVQNRLAYKEGAIKTNKLS